MKKLMIVLSVFLFTGCGTMVNQPSSIVEEFNPKGTKDELYVRANLLMIDIFNNAESVIQFSDKDAGVFKGKHLVYHQGATQYTSERKLFATLTVTVRDNYLKLKIDVHPYYNDGFNMASDGVNRNINIVKQSFNNEFNK